MPRHVTKRERYESIRTRPSSRSGTNYPCHDSHLRNLTDPYAPFAREYIRTVLPTAVHRLQEIHSRAPSEAAHAALRRLRDLHSLAESGQWWADIPFKIFADCDVGLFAGRLRGMVYLTWYDPRRGRYIPRLFFNFQLLMKTALRIGLHPS